MNYRPATLDQLLTRIGQGAGVNTPRDNAERLMGRVLAGQPMYFNWSWLSTGLHWERFELSTLRACVIGRQPIQRVADAFGRSPSSIVECVRKKLKLSPPRSWLDYVEEPDAQS